MAAGVTGRRRGRVGIGGRPPGKWKPRWWPRWLVRCSCGYEHHFSTRPTADMWFSHHQEQVGHHATCTKVEVMG